MQKNSLIVISDLHLADGHSMLEEFRAPQQEAFDGLLLAALPGGSLENTVAPELIINGDCFDFLVLSPYAEDGMATPKDALEKFEKIVAAHKSFFVSLRHFMAQGGKVTFIPGNHDIELCFAEVRSRLRQELNPEENEVYRLDLRIDRSYSPLPDVLIEHGNQFEFWNYARDVWDVAGCALTENPEQIMLPYGTQYMQRASLPISLRYPYFDHFEPPIGTTRQIALLSMIDPEIVVETARRTSLMMSHPYQTLQNLQPEDVFVPVRLFAEAMPDFANFQQDMLNSFPAWEAVEELLYSADERQNMNAAAIEEFFTLHLAMEQPFEGALQAIFQLSSLRGDEDTTRGMHTVLHDHPEVHVAIAGHTHIARLDQCNGSQVYLNTACWTLRETPPTSGEITPEIIDWLRQPERAFSPLHDKTAFRFAWVQAETNQPASARLCVWQGGVDGHYHILE